MSQSIPLVVGARVTCPKCGKPGTVKVETFRVNGREYRYWVVVHSGTRCVITKYEGEGEPKATIIATVTKSDARRGKVHVPASWVGRKVRVTVIG